MHIHATARPTAPSHHSGQRQATAGPLGWLAVIAAAAGLLWLIFGKALSSALAQWGQGGKTGGKWVRDRSLGGKMVSNLVTCFPASVQSCFNHAGDADMTFVTTVNSGPFCMTVLMPAYITELEMLCLRFCRVASGMQQNHK